MTDILDDIDAEAATRYGARKPGRFTFVLMALSVVFRRAEAELTAAMAARTARTAR